jgi:anti-sigma B factor antagonist
MFEITHHADWTVVKLSGDIDLAVAPALHQALIDVVDRPHPAIAVDFSQVEFMDSTGINLAVSGLKAVEARGGRFVLVSVPDRAKKLFALTGVDQVFEMYPSLDEAGQPTDGAATVT